MVTQKITEEEIATFEKFDLLALQEAIRQVELSMLDARETKKSLDKKILLLLSIYIPFSTLSLGLSGGEINGIYLHHPFVFLILGLFFAFGVILLLVSLLPGGYGSIGTYPILFLQPDFIQGNNQYYGYTLAIILFRYQEKLNLSDKRNEEKGKYMIRAIWLGVIPLASLPIGLIIYNLIKANLF